MVYVKADEEDTWRIPKLLSCLGSFQIFDMQLTKEEGDGSQHGRMFETHKSFECVVVGVRRA